jgi:photosystem II stability/assembly factor-like uncharacterized protein
MPRDATRRVRTTFRGTQAVRCPPSRAWVQETPEPIGCCTGCATSDSIHEEAQMGINRVLPVTLTLASLILVASLAAPVLGQELPFTETFDDPALTRWEHSPTATVADGALRVESGGFAFHPARWGDMSLVVRARTSGDGELFIRYRWSEDANYAVRLAPGLVAVQRQLLGPATDLGTSMVTIEAGEWVDLAVTVTGGTHQVTIDGAPVLTATDPNPLPEGGIGFTVEGDATGDFDDLEVAPDGQLPPSGEATPMPEPTPGTEAPVSPAGARAFQAASWVRLGGPPGGLGYDIRYKFDDPGTWYVTDAYTGFFISHDRGLTWEPSNDGIARLEGTTIVPIFSATVDPHHPNVIWIGTQFSGHIYRSTDGGVTWAQKDNGVEPHQGHSFRGFTVDPRSSDIVYAAAEVEGAVFRDAGTMPDARDGTQGGRVYRTTNGGESWELIWEGPALARYVWIDPTDPDVLYVSTGFFDRSPLNQPENPTATNCGGIGVLKSLDGGQTWMELGHEHGIQSLQISSLYMKQDDPQTLLAGGGSFYVPPVLVDGVETEYGGVYLTTNGGQSWEAVVQNVVITSVEYCDKDPQIAYAGGAKALYRSEDGGHTWQRYGDEARGTWGPPGLNPGVPVDIQVDPDDCNRLFLNNYVGGNFLSTDGGQTWAVATQGYSGAAPTRVVVDPHDPWHVLAASRMAPFVSHDGGLNWEGLLYPELLSGIRTLELDPTDSSHLLASADVVLAPILETHDGGKRWESRLDWVDRLPSGTGEADWAPLRVKRIAFAPSDPLIVYATTLHAPTDPDMPLPEGWQYDGLGVYRSDDGGETWEPANDDTIGELGFGCIAVDPTDAQTVYAGTYFDRGLFKTTDGGSTWVPIDEGLPRPYRYFDAMAIDPVNPQVVYAAGRVGVFKSSDGGASWSQLTGGLDPQGGATAIVVDPTNTQVVYVGTSRLGLFYSKDGGARFQPLRQGIEEGGNLAIADLSLSADGTVLYAAVTGAGVYRLGTPSGVGLEASPTAHVGPGWPAGTPSASQTAAPGPSIPSPFAGGGICPGAAALPIALLGLIWRSRRANRR